MPVDDVNSFLLRLPETLKGYDAKDIFNADETALYYRQLPERTLEVRGSSAHGCKRSKERFTLLLCSSMSGEKLKPLVVGRYNRPRCFSGVDMKQLPCSYSHSRNAWMTAAIFQSWLRDLNQTMAISKRHIMLFVDNAPCHRLDESLSNIQLAYLPPNCTSLLQPMDQGIIWSFKCKFRKILLDLVLSGIDAELQARMVQNIHILQAIHLVKQAWFEVHPDVIINSFRKAGFISDTVIEAPEESDPECDEDFYEYVSIDYRLFDEELRQIDLSCDEVSHDPFINFHIAYSFGINTL